MPEEVSFPRGGGRKVKNSFKGFFFRQETRNSISDVCVSFRAIKDFMSFDILFEKHRNWL